MMFRAMGHGHAPHGRVIWGPFPAPWSALGTALAALFIGAIMFAVSLQHQEFRCAAGPTAACSVNEKAVFARASIHRVDVVIERGSKNSKFGVVTFTLERAQTYKLMRIDPDDANEAAAKIRMGLTSGEAIDVEVHESRVMLVIGIVGLVSFVVMLIIALRRMGHYDLIVSPDAQTLLVKRSLFAFPLTTTSISLARVAGVVVERKPIMPPLASRYTVSTNHARLGLMYRGIAAIEPLTKNFFPGHALHLRAAAALRRALEVDPDDVDDGELSKIPMRTTPMSQRLGFAWAGLTTGSLFGLLLFGLSMMVLGQIKPRENLEGWIFLGGMIPGAIGGVAIVMHATRPRLPR